MNRELSRAWNQWVEVTSGARQALGVLDHAIRGFINREVKRGWLGWHSIYLERVRTRDALRGV